MGNIPYAAGDIDYTVGVPRGEHTPWVTSNTPWGLSRGMQVIHRGYTLWGTFVRVIRRGEHAPWGTCFPRSKRCCPRHYTTVGTPPWVT